MADKQIILKDVRLWWHDAFKPSTDRTDEKTGRNIPGQYKATVIFAPDSEAGKLARAAFQEVAAAEFGPNWAVCVEAIPAQGKCIRNGDHKLDDDGNSVEAFKDMLYLSASRDPARGGPPLVIDSFFTNGAPTKITEDSGRIYRGCKVNLKIEISAYTSKNKEVGRRISAKFLVMQFAGDGEAFGSAPPTADGFEDMGGAPSLDGVDANTAALFG